MGGRECTRSGATMRYDSISTTVQWCSPTIMHQYSSTLLYWYSSTRTVGYPDTCLGMTGYPVNGMGLHRATPVPLSTAGCL
jgi:hypothetical protein